MSILEGADMWYAKMYFSEKKEVFQFDSHGVQGVPSTYEELPFLESLLSFLEADCKELEPLLRRAYENWSLLIDRDDRDAGVRTLMDLGDLGSRHIYLHLLYVRWFERFGRMGITQDRGSREDQADAGGAAGPSGTAPAVSAAGTAFL